MSKRKKILEAPATKAERDARAAAGLCRTCKPPPAKPFCRGVCPKCYRVYDRNKRAGNITEQAAVDQGLISPSANRGVKGSSGMEEALRRARAR
jgi:hypothetical protein